MRDRSTAGVPAGQPDRSLADDPVRGLRVAIVHDWLTGMRGGEKVLDAICEIYRNATLFTFVRSPGSVSAGIEAHRIRTSVVQWLPASRRLYRHYLPLYPAAVEWFDLDGYDLVISSSHCAVKSVVAPGRAVHVCYCHSPMRYAWDQFPAYFGREQVGRVRHAVMRPLMAAVARWDAATAGRVDAFVANSAYVAGRISRYYNRRSTVVYPPVDTAFYRPSDNQRPVDRAFLVVSALVPYKCLDVAIEACRRVGAPLKIVGQGPELPRLRRLAGPEVEFLGWRSDEEIRELYRQSAAVLLPGVEDFGIVPLEAQACGCPVVAYGRGGATETVVHGRTGLLVEEATAPAFAEALSSLPRQGFDPAVVRQHALQFSRDRFVKAFHQTVDVALARPRRAAPEQPG